VRGTGTAALALAAACTASSAAPPAPSAATDTISTVAGNGAPGYDGEYLVAVSTTLDTPVDVDFDARGRALIIDWNNHRVRALEADGTLVTAIGTGEELFGEPNLMAHDFPVHHPLDLLVTPEGEWIIAGYHDPRVLRVDTAGRVRVLAGFGAQGDAGDGGAATLAFLDAPAAVARGARGETYVADELEHRLRKISADGTIEAFAGTRIRGYSGDGGPAREAQLDGPLCIAEDRKTGDVYICDTGNHAIRRVDPQGVIHTVAGNGRPGFGGDGGPASAAQLYRPIDLVLLDDGAYLVVDSENHRIRRVRADGIIETVVGTSTGAFAGDGGPASKAALHTPWGIAVDAAGRLWIADSGNHRVRRVEAGLLGGARTR